MGCKIGRNCVIGAFSFVKKDIPRLLCGCGKSCPHSKTLQSTIGTMGENRQRREFHIAQNIVYYGLF
ncbi:hypothetical protein NIB75_11590 [Bacteroides uniformis]|nr:hypothetical protein [Bacteroides uniformis]